VVAASPGPLAATAIAGPAPLRRTGLFHVGLALALPEVGPLQVVGHGTSAAGALFAIGAEVDLSARTALRVPLEVAYAGSSTTSAGGVEQSSNFYLAVGFAPSVLYRFRDRADQRWVPYVGGGVRFGFFQFGRGLLGLAPNPPPATEQEFIKAGAAPELTGGIVFSPARWFSLRIALDYTYIFVAHTSLHALSETIAPQITF
jgi:hypothetical protein